MRPRTSRKIASTTGKSHSPRGAGVPSARHSRRSNSSGGNRQELPDLAPKRRARHPYGAAASRMRNRPLVQAVTHAGLAGSVALAEAIAHALELRAHARGGRGGKSDGPCERGALHWNVRTARGEKADHDDGQ